MFENPRRGGQARNFTTNVPKILDLKSSSEQVFSENCRWVPLAEGSVEGLERYNLCDLISTYKIRLGILLLVRKRNISGSKKL